MGNYRISLPPYRASWLSFRFWDASGKLKTLRQNCNVLQVLPKGNNMQVNKCRNSEMSLTTTCLTLFSFRHHHIFLLLCSLDLCVHCICIVFKKNNNTHLEKRLNGFVQQWLTHFHRCRNFHIDTDWTTLVLWPASSWIHDLSLNEGNMHADTYTATPTL